MNSKEQNIANGDNNQFFSILHKYWKALTVLASVISATYYFAYNFGHSNCNNEKYELQIKYDTLVSQFARVNRQADTLRKDTTRFIATILTLRKIDEINQKNKKSISNNIKHSHNNEKTLSTDNPSSKPNNNQNEINNEDPKALEIKNLKAVNMQLKRNIELLQTENAGLKRKVQKFVSKQDSLITELDILYDIYKTKQGKEKQDYETQFSELLTKIKEEKLKFDAADDGKEFQREIEEYKNKQAEIEKQNAEQKQALIKLSNELANLKSQNAVDYYNNAKSTLRSAEGLFNWFGINSKEKCNLIIQVIQSYDEATKLGRDCTKEIEILKEKYRKCL